MGFRDTHLRLIAQEVPKISISEKEFEKYTHQITSTYLRNHFL